MRSTFREFIEPSEEEKSKTWNKATFVFDTNVLLNLYRYTRNTRRGLIESIKNLKGRVWLPYQVVYEFMKNRYQVIYDTVDRYDSLLNSSKKLISEIRENLRLGAEDDSIRKLESNITEWIDERKKSDLLVINPAEDQILDEIMEIFEGKVGKERTMSEVNKLVEEAAIRYEKEIPPGYKDRNNNVRDTNGMYGDYLIWKEIIDQSKMMKTDIVFVTYDQKEDWWNRVKGKTIGPRIELRREFMRETKKTLLMYSMNSFLKIATRAMGSTERKEIMEEIEYVKKKLERTENRNLSLYNRVEKLKQGIKKREKVIKHLEEKYATTKEAHLLIQIANTKANMKSKENELRQIVIKLDSMDS